jgi:hypothetical protein
MPDGGAPGVKTVPLSKTGVPPARDVDGAGDRKLLSELIDNVRLIPSEVGDHRLETLPEQSKREVEAETVVCVIGRYCRLIPVGRRSTLQCGSRTIRGAFAIVSGETVGWPKNASTSSRTRGSRSARAA